MIGILCMTPESHKAVLFYAIAVLVMKMTCFMVMIKVARDGRNLQIAELAGLHNRAPMLAMALMLALFGLAGIPPTIGFAGKFLVFTAAIQSDYIVLVIIAMINVVISLYYYLLVLKAAYLDEPQQPVPDFHVSPATNMIALGLIAIIMTVGFYPHILLPLVQSATLALW